MTKQRSAPSDLLTVQVRLSELRTDGEQYKPKSPMFTPENVWVEVSIPRSVVIEYDPKTKRLVLSPAGPYLLAEALLHGQLEATTLYHTTTRRKS